MHGTAPKVSGLFLPPTTEDCKKAISIALIRIRANGCSRDKLASALGCKPTTIDNATSEKALLSFDSLALLAHHFPDEWKLVERIWTGGAVAPLTVPDRIDRIERDLDAIRRATA